MTEPIECHDCGRLFDPEDALDCPACGEHGAGPNPEAVFCSRSCRDSHHADVHEPKSPYQLRARRYAEEGAGDE